MRSIPAVPLALGFAGLVPFGALAIAIFVPAGGMIGPYAVTQALATYAAIILSFLGGIRWGLAAGSEGANAPDYIAAVVPSLIGWVLLAAQDPWRLAGLGTIILILGPIDARMVVQGRAPRWLGRLRLILSTGAGIATLLGAIGSARS